MPGRKMLVTLAMSMSVLAPVGAQAQGQAKALTAMDYIEIQQLVAKYPYALDTHAEKWIHVR